MGLAHRSAEEFPGVHTDSAADAETAADSLSEGDRVDTAAGADFETAAVAGSDTAADDTGSDTGGSCSGIAEQACHCSHAGIADGFAEDGFPAGEPSCAEPGPGANSAAAPSGRTRAGTARPMPPRPIPRGQPEPDHVCSLPHSSLAPAVLSLPYRAFTAPSDHLSLDHR